MGGVAMGQLPQNVKVIKTGDGKNLNIISNSGNGVGNSIVVDGDGTGSTTIINGYPNGVGNKIVVDGQKVLNQPGLIDNNWTLPEDIKALMEQDWDQWVPEAAKKFLPPGVGNKWMPDCRAVPGKTNVVYKGKDNRFYQFSVFSPELDCMMYWDARTLTFFRYMAAEDCYRPVDWAQAMPQQRPMPPVVD